MSRNGYKIADAHCHIYPEKIASKAVAGTDRFYEITKSAGEGTVDHLIEREGQYGVDKFVVQSVATTAKQVSSINRFIADEVAAYPDKLTGLGTLHPESEDISADVEQIISLGLHGVKLHPDIQGFPIDDPRCIKMFELCRGRLPILCHTGDFRYDNSNPNRVIPILKAFPDLTFIGAHFGGWSIWEQASKELCDFENFYVDCSSSFYGLPDNKTVCEIIHRYGADKVMFGTDYPMWDIEPELDRFFSLNLTETENRAILYDNAARVYKID